jgi:AcrR family transcriptional regulator
MALMVDSTGPGAPLGLRERKKQKTRAAIQREALRLIREQGYEATTVEQIAAAAEVSPSTFFNYFPTKEDVVLRDEYDPVFVSAFLARPPEEPLSVAIRNACRALMLLMQRDQDLVLWRAKLMLEVPELRARGWEEIEKAQELFSAVMAERTGRNPDDLEVRVTVASVIGAMFEVSKEWVRRDGQVNFEELVERALDVIESGIRLDEPSRGGP